MIVTTAIRAAAVSTMLLASVIVGGTGRVYADPGCPDVDLSFVRGTDEPPGLGDTGQALVTAVVPLLPKSRVEPYAVNYPASRDFHDSTIAGVADLTRHIRSVEMMCLKTKLVFGGFSQGAAVAGYTTSPVVPAGIDGTDGLTPLSPEEASRVVAVVLMGTPTAPLTGLLGGPPVTVGPEFSGKTLMLCAEDDLVCTATDNGSWAAHNTYTYNEMAGQAAQFISDAVTGHGPSEPWPVSGVEAPEPTPDANGG